MTRPASQLSAADTDPRDERADEVRKPEEGGSQSGPQIDESEIDAPGNDHSPTTENDVT